LEKEEEKQFDHRVLVVCVGDIYAPPLVVPLIECIQLWPHKGSQRKTTYVLG